MGGGVELINGAVLKETIESSLAASFLYTSKAPTRHERLDLKLPTL